MKLKRSILFLFILSLGLIVYSSNDFFYRSDINKKLSDLGATYIELKYNEPLKIKNIETYSSKKGIFNNSIEEAIITTDNNYSIFIDLTCNKIYDNKQYSEIRNSIKKDLVLNTPFDNYYTINELDVFQKRAEHFKSISDNLGYFDINSYYDGDINKLLSENNINIDLDISFQNTFGKFYYKDKCLDYINTLKPYFLGGQSTIFVNIYKESRYNNKSERKNVCEVYSYQHKDNWDDTVYQQNYINITGNIEASSLLSNSIFSDYNDCVFYTEDIPQNLKCTKPNYTFASRLYYFDYTSQTINKCNLCAADQIAIRVSKNSFENGSLYLDGILEIVSKNSDDTYTLTDVNANNSYTDGGSIVVTMPHGSSLVLLMPSK